MVVAELIYFYYHFLHFSLFLAIYFIKSGIGFGFSRPNLNTINGLRLMEGWSVLAPRLE
jgi:hypothetical protein